MIDEKFILHIKNCLISGNQTQEAEDTKLKKAAVLLPLFFDQGVWKLMFIHRSNFGEFHKGEVAFPGGKQEPEDNDLLQTALRETEEELGISPTCIEILGTLASRSTISGYWVTPVVGLLNWPVEINYDRIEVERVFSIPLNWLMDNENWNVKELNVHSRGNISTIIFDMYDNETLWGFSARVTQSFIELIKKGER